jgi:hypothetical protein
VQHKPNARRRPEMLAISSWCIYQALGKPDGEHTGREAILVVPRVVKDDARGRTPRPTFAHKSPNFPRSKNQRAC